ncbi:AcrR family transcriptional regulator [Clostridium punense]|uniref:AcrR family transcriptional regulator n=3 Tax=root TaxID=1 RepID=A0ABS4K1G4_9CLOT|nr:MULTISPECIES: TetR/AcrR family transcriptional regulator [Clostridium]EQB87412.1 hypothetical protein M918_09195 [Clostridium sp. BL8]MBP2021622.1 AcrR family transcriptional regulator [Clostridium punense]
MNKTKMTIFEAAIKTFSNSGYNGTTMDQVAEAAGVAKGTLYYHFKSKEEIFNFIIEEGLGILVDELKEHIKVVTDPLEKLRIICKAQLAILYRNKDFFKVLMSQLWGQEIRQVELRNKLGIYIEEIKVFFQEAMDAGIIRKGNAYFMAYAFFGTLCSAAVYEVINIDRIDLDDVVDELIEYSLRGLKA